MSFCNIGNIGIIEFVAGNRRRLHTCKVLQGNWGDLSLVAEWCKWFAVKGLVSFRAFSYEAASLR